MVAAELTSVPCLLLFGMVKLVETEMSPASLEVKHRYNDSAAARNNCIPLNSGLLR
jgi:hypothetical protein